MADWTPEQRSMVDRMLRNWMENPETLERLIQSFQEEPKDWLYDDNESTDS